MQWMLDTYIVDGNLQHTYKNGVARIYAKLDDYACLVAAMLQLASITGEQSLIVRAASITEIVQRDFLHDDKTFFYYSSITQTDIPVRKTDLYDGATPSANGMMAANLIWLGMVMERSAWIEQGRYMLNQMQGQAARYATSFSGWAVLGQRMAAGYVSLVVAGEGVNDALNRLNRRLLPHAFILRVREGSNSVPLSTGKHSNDGLKLYVCDTESCRLATTDIEQVEQMLGNKL
ncbi:MAG: thioredoxin domain-containing protein [Taibaiella sp.]|nr:thioredoxin domain-containing protein [Taibaiella sp.]